MAKRQNAKAPTGADPSQIDDYRHQQAKRKNNPPAKIAAEGTVPAIPKAVYAYNPHLPPVLRFDASGAADKLPKLLEKATREKLTVDEARLLADALRRQEPWLEWAGKREAKSFEVDPVALHIHERISAQAILKVAARQDVERTLFGGGTEQAYQEAVQFYRHDIDWTNRLILGDSLAVMSSLAKREDLAGKVQMIYMDPPYGIKFSSNFQPVIGRRDVKDKEQDLTREPEMVKAYRDTWELGIHSYMSYLRDRLVVARDLLADTGSIFVQISDENIHRVRSLLDEVFGTSNHIVDIVVKKKGSQKGGSLEPINDYLIWYVRNRGQARIRPVFIGKAGDADLPDRFDRAEMQDGRIERLAGLPGDEIRQALAQGAIPIAADPLMSGGEFKTQLYDVHVNGEVFKPPRNNSWKLGEYTMKRVVAAERILVGDKGIRFKKYLSDFDRAALTNFWDDLSGASDKVYVVQTNSRIVERCLLMTTDPGDLVIDPTCGSGTTAAVAEQWGRRWITTDTSRVALAIARQRLMTAKFDFLQLRDESRGVAGNFIYRTVPHITLQSIANNVALDPIFAKHGPLLDRALAAANVLLPTPDSNVLHSLCQRFAKKIIDDGVGSLSDADYRRWLLPRTPAGVLDDAINAVFAKMRKKPPTWRQKAAIVDRIPPESRWRHWEVPFDTDDQWPKELPEAVAAYRKAWRAKMDDVNACISASAEQEELVDRPQVVRGVVRVSGPFTVEAVQPPEMSLGDVMAVGDPGLGMTEAGFDGAPSEVGPTFAMRPVESGLGATARDLTAYLDKMVRLLRMDGVGFPNNKRHTFSRLEPIFETRGSGFHAEGRWVKPGETDADPQGPTTAGVVIGPQYGPVTAKMVEDLIRPASRRYEDLVIAGFSFTGEAQAIIGENT